MILRYLFAGLCLINSVAFATDVPSCFCPGGAVFIDNHRADVIGRCGNPDAINYKQVRRGYSSWGVEELIYDFGPTKFVHSINISGDKVISIESHGYGSKSSTSNAGPNAPTRSTSTTTTTTTTIVRNYPQPVQSYGSTKSSSTTYKWEDAGGVHFTDNVEAIPAEYREKVIAAARQEASPQTAPPAPADVPPPQVNREPVPVLVPAQTNQTTPPAFLDFLSDHWAQLLAALLLIPIGVYLTDKAHNKPRRDKDGNFKL